jgi:hypothetical protein
VFLCQKLIRGRFLKNGVRVQPDLTYIGSSVAETFLHLSYASTLLF